MTIEHGDITPVAHPSGNRGVHGIEGFNAVVDEAARSAIVQTAADRGRVVRQTAGAAPGWYVADGAGGWQAIGSGGGLSVVLYDNPSGDLVMLAGSEYQVDQAQTINFDPAPAEGARVRLRLFSSNSIPLGNYSAVFQFPAGGGGWIDAGAVVVGGPDVPPGSLLEWEWRSAGQAQPRWYLVGTNIGVLPFLQLPPQWPTDTGYVEPGDFSLDPGQFKYYGTNNDPKVLTLPIASPEGWFLGFGTSDPGQTCALTVNGPLVADDGSFVSTLALSGFLYRVYLWSTRLQRWVPYVVVPIPGAPVIPS